MSENQSKPAEREQTVGEEIFNAISHGIGALLAIACLVVAVVYSCLSPYRSVWNIVGVSIYGASMFLLYLFSCLYHAITAPRAKAVLNYFDHCSIYLLIAGSYTPICLGGLRAYSPGWGWSIFGVEWLLAILGIVFQCLCINRYRMLSNATYLAMGWVVLIALYPIYKALGLSSGSASAACSTPSASTSMSGRSASTCTQSGTCSSWRGRWCSISRFFSTSSSSPPAARRRPGLGRLLQPAAEVKCGEIRLAEGRFDGGFNCLPPGADVKRQLGGEHPDEYRVGESRIAQLDRLCNAVAALQPGENPLQSLVDIRGIDGGSARNGDGHDDLVGHNRQPAWLQEVRATTRLDFLQRSKHVRSAF